MKREDRRKGETTGQSRERGKKNRVGEERGEKEDR